MFVTKKQTILADSRGRRAPLARAGLALVRVGAEPETVHAEVFDVTSPTPPSWWPKSFAWPPSPTPPSSWGAGAKWPPTTVEELTTGTPAVVANAPPESVPAPTWWPSSLAWPPSLAAPPGWAVTVRWPPTNAEELSAGMSAAATAATAATAPAPSGMTPGQKDAVAVGAGALVGGVVAKIAMGAGAVGVGPIALGAVLGALFGHAFYAMATGNPLTSVATKGCGCGGPPHPAEYPTSTGAMLATTPPAARKKLSGGADYDRGLAVGYAACRRDELGLMSRNLPLAAPTSSYERGWTDGVMKCRNERRVYPAVPIDIKIKTRGFESTYGMM